MAGGILMISHNLTQRLLFSPIDDGADALLILSGYASPNMASWLIKSQHDRHLRPIDIRLVVGMTSYDGISLSAHEGFKVLHGKNYGNSMSRFQCSYVYDSEVPVHANLYIWTKQDAPILAFTGSADFLQSAFLSGRMELAENCAPSDALDYFNEIEGKSIFCNHSEVEEHIVLHGKHDILDEEGKLTLSGEGIVKATLPLLSRNGETGEKSSLNWGQRNKRNKNQAYIPLPSSIAKNGFFPLNKQHFTARTDDGHTLVLRVEQQGNKAITTPLSNAQLGEYFRNRLGLANGAYVAKQDLINYGRTDVTFYKIDDEVFFLDFSVHKET